MTTAYDALAIDQSCDSHRGARAASVLLDADMHSDQEAELLSEGVDQKDLCGINLYPALPSEDFLEFDSMINLRGANRRDGSSGPAPQD